MSVGAIAMRAIDGALDVLTLYRARMRNRSVLIQEGFAALGLAVGVALLFASQVSSTSLDRSVAQLNEQVVGRVDQLQLEARGPGGFNIGLLRTVQHIPGVLGAMPVLEAPINVIGPHGRASVQLLGADPKTDHIGGPLVKNFTSKQLASIEAVALPSSISQTIGVHALEPVKLQVGATIRPAVVGAILHEEEVGALAGSPIAFVPIAYAQKLTGLHGRASRIYIRAAASRLPQVRQELAALAARRHVNLTPARFDATLFAQAGGPESQGEILFSAISALVGFMLALNALLITVPARRKLLDAVRLSGATPSMCVRILLFDAAVLAVSGAVIGLLLGELLSIEVFRSTPGYLASAFPVGTTRIVTAESIAIAGVASFVAATIGVLWPARDLLGSPRAREGTRRRSDRALITARLVLGSGCVSATTVILFLAPSAAIPGAAILVIGLVCLLPALFDFCVWLFGVLQGPWLSAATKLAVTELQTPATRVRSLAIAATGAVAVFGTVSVGGAQTNLQDGLDASAHAIDASASVWVIPAGQSSILATLPFQGGIAHRLAQIPGVRAVGTYRGNFLNWRDRRLWIQAQPRQSLAPVPAGQLVAGSLADARADIRAGGWAVVSEDLADEHHLHVGARFVLPSPHPITLRVAGLATNLGWPPGAIVMSSSDYVRAWGSWQPSAYEIQTDSGASALRVKHAVERLLGRHSGFAVETRAQRQRRLYALAAQGLSRLTQIRILVLLATILATAGAMGAMLWQRRELVGWVKCQGYGVGVLWRWLFWECGVMLGAGSLIGAAFGVYGQLLNSHALAIVTGFPVDIHVGASVAVVSFASVTAVAVAIIPVAGYLVVRVQPRTASPSY